MPTMEKLTKIEMRLIASVKPRKLQQSTERRSFYGPRVDSGRVSLQRGVVERRFVGRDGSQRQDEAAPNADADHFVGIPWVDGQ